MSWGLWEANATGGDAGHEPISRSSEVKGLSRIFTPEALCAKYSELAMKHFEKLAKVE